MAEFIEIDDDIFQKEKIISVQYEDNKNSLGKENGEYTIIIYLDCSKGSLIKLFSNKKARDTEFKSIKEKLL